MTTDILGRPVDLSYVCKAAGHRHVWTPVEEAHDACPG